MQPSVALAPAAPAVASLPATATAQPAHATYRCDDGSSLVIDNRRSAVVVTGEDGERVDLPASPAGSDTRYGSGAYALVLEENEALWMKAGREPATCLR